jgi:hypothetical protein
LYASAERSHDFFVGGAMQDLGDGLTFDSFLERKYKYMFSLVQKKWI